MGLWMGRNCRGITNNTDALFQLDSNGDSGGIMGQGYSASITRANHTMMVNSVAKSPLFTIRKHVRFWGLAERHTGMDLVREIRVLTHEPIRTHPNIISLIAFEWTFWPGDEPSISPVICLERSELGDLATFQRKHQLSYSVKRQLFRDAANGLVALHDSGIVHGDVKCENLLVFPHEDGYHAKLCDFGFAVFLGDVKGEKAGLLGGTVPWTAPEFRRDLPYPQHFLKLTDVYSLGLLLWRVLLDGENPFKHHLLDPTKDAEQLKIGEPPLLHFAQASILLRPEYSPHANEIFSLLACTLQKQPLKRKLRTAIQIVGEQRYPIIPRVVAQLSNNPLIFAREAFIIKNICVPLRLRMMKHLQRSASQIHSDPDWRSDFPGENPIVNGLIDVALGDGGLDLDDDPAEALRWITLVAQQQYIPMQAIIVRMYDYFNQPMPLEVQRKANEYLANGVLNGSHTAALDYTTFWPTLQFQTWGSPDDFLFNSRTFYGNGTGFQLDQKAAELWDTAAVYKNLIKMGGETTALHQMYGLDKGNTLLHGFAMLGLAETVQLLLGEFKVDINARNDNGDTPLLLACRNGKSPLVVKLVTKGARADIANIFGETPLHWVLNIPNQTIDVSGVPGNMLSLAIDLLIYGGGSLRAHAEMWCSAGDFYNRLRWAAGTPLHRAVSRRHLDAAKALLSKGAEATSLDGSEERLTPMDIAMHQHNEPMLRLLLDNCHFDTNTRYADGHTVYSRAVAAVTVIEMITIHGKEYPKAVSDTLDLLISRGFDITRSRTVKVGKYQYELDALFVAVTYEKLAWVQYFLSSKTCMKLLDVNRPNGEHGMTALHQSIHDHRKSIFNALLDAGADPNLTCSTWSIRLTGIDTNTTSLHLVAQQGDPDLFFTTRLLTYSLDIDATDYHGTTPFACAVIEGNLHIANTLLKHNADINRMMGPRNSNPEIHTTVLAHILSRDCTLVINRLKFLLSTPQDDIDPPLRRHGPAATFLVGQSKTALHLFLDSHRNRDDAPFRTCLQILLEAFPLPTQLNYRDKQQRTPLHIAASHANILAVSALLDAGATRDVVDGEGQTPEDLVNAANVNGGDEYMQRRILDLLRGV
ncbi:hypothetical protein BDW59DRAFT_145225 [Aspergillus cavernicola]|uniref:Protein kinase domain-containing protein n=1 Tax=Aspergillus cavernicola TaxID=176166 RepID=A0ABR4IFE8_9EURO